MLFLLLCSANRITTRDVVAAATVTITNGQGCPATKGKAITMQATAKALEDVCDNLTDALDDLDVHGQAMAALHLAMAVDCLRASLSAGEGERLLPKDVRPQLRLVATS